MHARNHLVAGYVGMHVMATVSLARLDTHMVGRHSRTVGLGRVSSTGAIVWAVKNGSASRDERCEIAEDAGSVKNMAGAVAGRAAPLRRCGTSRARPRRRGLGIAGDASRVAGRAAKGRGGMGG